VVIKPDQLVDVTHHGGVGHPLTMEDQNAY
jgi:hypothetical protein